MITVSLAKTKGSVYIGRRSVYGESPLANPFKLTDESQRIEILEKYKQWLNFHLENDTACIIDELERLYQLALQGDLVLGCYCSPKPCHGDYIKEVLEYNLSLRNNYVHYFRGEYSFLSNFYLTPVYFNNYLFLSSEHAYQASKTTPDNWYRFDKISSSSAKQLGKKLPINKNFDRIKNMKTVLESKFKNPKMNKLLKNTGNKILIEGNHWNDKFWGVCNGQGENNLGRLLMEIRNGEK